MIVYGDGSQRLEALDKPAVPRAEVIDELCAAVKDDRAPLHDGEWALATLEVCVAMLRSAREVARRRRSRGRCARRRGIIRVR